MLLTNKQMLQLANNFYLAIKCLPSILVAKKNPYQIPVPLKFNCLVAKEWMAQTHNLQSLIHQNFESFVCSSSVRNKGSIEQSLPPPPPIITT